MCICNDCKKGCDIGLVRGVSDLASGEYYNGPEICESCMLVRRERAIAEYNCSLKMDTGDLINDPFYEALDELYHRGWSDRNKELKYDPRGTKQWQNVLDLFRLQKKKN